MPSPTEGFRQRCSERLGHSLPVWPWRSLNRRLFRYSCIAALARRCDSSNVPLLGFNSPSRSLLDIPAPVLPGAALLGFSLPYSASSIGDPRPLQFPALALPAVFHPCGVEPLASQRLKSGWDSAGGSQTTDYGAAHRLFQPLSGFLSPIPSHHFQAGNARGVLPFRGFPSHAAPYGSSPPACPLDVAPSV